MPKSKQTKQPKQSKQLLLAVTVRPLHLILLDYLASQHGPSAENRSELIRRAIEVLALKHFDLKSFERFAAPRIDALPEQERRKYAEDYSHLLKQQTCDVDADWGTLGDLTDLDIATNVKVFEV